MDGDVNITVVGLIAERFVRPVHFLIELFAFKVECLELLVEVLLEELLGQIGREPEGEAGVDDAGRPDKRAVLTSA